MFPFFAAEEREFAHSMFLAWAETVRDLKTSRMRDERSIEKTWVMLEEEKKLNALSTNQARVLPLFFLNSVPRLQSGPRVDI